MELGQPTAAFVALNSALYKDVPRRVSVVPAKNEMLLSTLLGRKAPVFASHKAFRFNLVLLV